MIKKLMTGLMTMLFLLMTGNIVLADAAVSPVAYVLPLLVYVILIVILVVAAIVIIRLVRKGSGKAREKKGNRNL